MIEQVQSKRVKPWLRVVAFITLTIFTYNSTVQASGYAPSQTPNSLDAPKSLNEISIPASFGQIKKTFHGEGHGVVVHIQNAHVNEEAQKNIANILHYLVKNYGLDLVSLEGATGDLPTYLFGAFPDKSTRKQVTDYYLKAGRLTGAEQLAIVEDTHLKLFGVENPDLYQANRAAFLDTLSFKAEDEEILAKVDKILKNLVQYVFDEETRELIKAREAYEADSAKLLNYVNTLVNLAKKHGIDMTQHLSVQALLSLVELEKNIHFEDLDKQLSALADVLKTWVSPIEKNKFLTNVFQFKNKKVSDKVFANYLSGVVENARKSSLKEKFKVEIQGNHSNILNYLQYLKFYESIDAAVFDEISQIETSLKSILLTTQEPKEVDRLMTVHRTMRKMMDFSLSKEDAEFYFKNRPDFNAEVFSKVLNPIFEKNRFSEKLPENFSKVIADLKRVEKFYEAAIARDEALIENAMSRMRKENHKVSAVITGGFHTPGLERYLSERKISYVVITPKITKAFDAVKDQEKYDAAMADKPLPIEQGLAKIRPASESSELADPRFQLEVPLFISADLTARAKQIIPYYALHFFTYLMSNKKVTVAEMIRSVRGSYPNMSKEDAAAIESILVQAMPIGQTNGVSEADQKTPVSRFFYRGPGETVLVYEIAPKGSRNIEGKSSVVASESFEYGSFSVSRFSLPITAIKDKSIAALFEKSQPSSQAASLFLLETSASPIKNIQDIPARIQSVLAVNSSKVDAISAQNALAIEMKKADRALKQQVATVNNFEELIALAKSLASSDNRDLRGSQLMSAMRSLSDLVINRAMSLIDDQISAVEEKRFQNLNKTVVASINSIDQIQPLLAAIEKMKGELSEIKRLVATANPEGDNWSPSQKAAINTRLQSVDSVNLALGTTLESLQIKEKAILEKQADLVKAVKPTITQRPKPALAPRSKRNPLRKLNFEGLELRQAMAGLPFAGVLALSEGLTNEITETVLVGPAVAGQTEIAGLNEIVQEQTAASSVAPQIIDGAVKVIPDANEVFANAKPIDGNGLQYLQVRMINENKRIDVAYLASIDIKNGLVVADPTNSLSLEKMETVRDYLNNKSLPTSKSLADALLGERGGGGGDAVGSPVGVLRRSGDGGGGPGNGSGGDGGSGGVASANLNADIIEITSWLEKSPNVETEIGEVTLSTGDKVKFSQNLDKLILRDEEGDLLGEYDLSGIDQLFYNENEDGSLTLTFRFKDGKITKHKVVLKKDQPSVIAGQPKAGDIVSEKHTKQLADGREVIYHVHYQYVPDASGKLEKRVIAHFIELPNILNELVEIDLEELPGRDKEFNEKNWNYDRNSNQLVNEDGSIRLNLSQAGKAALKGEGVAEIAVRSEVFSDAQFLNDVLGSVSGAVADAIAAFTGQPRQETRSVSDGVTRRSFLSAGAGVIGLVSALWGNTVARAQDLFSAGEKGGLLAQLLAVLNRGKKIPLTASEVDKMIRSISGENALTPKEPIHHWDKNKLAEFMPNPAERQMTIDAAEKILKSMGLPVSNDGVSAENETMTPYDFATEFLMPVMIQLNINGIDRAKFLEKYVTAIGKTLKGLNFETYLDDNKLMEAAYEIPNLSGYQAYLTEDMKREIRNLVQKRNIKNIPGNEYIQEMFRAMVGNISIHNSVQMNLHFKKSAVIKANGLTNLNMDSVLGLALNYAMQNEPKHFFESVYLTATHHRFNSEALVQRVQLINKLNGLWIYLGLFSMAGPDYAWQGGKNKGLFNIRGENLGFWLEGRTEGKVGRAAFPHLSGNELEMIDGQDLAKGMAMAILQLRPLMFNRWVKDPKTGEYRRPQTGMELIGGNGLDIFSSYETLLENVLNPTVVDSAYVLLNADIQDPIFQEILERLYGGDYSYESGRIVGYDKDGGKRVVDEKKTLKIDPKVLFDIVIDSDNKGPSRLSAAQQWEVHNLRVLSQRYSAEHEIFRNQFRNFLLNIILGNESGRASTWIRYGLEEGLIATTSEKPARGTSAEATPVNFSMNGAQNLWQTMQKLKMYAEAFTGNAINLLWTDDVGMLSAMAENVERNIAAYEKRNAADIELLKAQVKFYSSQESTALKNKGKILARQLDIRSQIVDLFSLVLLAGSDRQKMMAALSESLEHKRKMEAMYKRLIGEFSSVVASKQRQAYLPRLQDRLRVIQDNIKSIEGLQSQVRALPADSPLFTLQTKAARLLSALTGEKKYAEQGFDFKDLKTGSQQIGYMFSITMGTITSNYENLETQTAFVAAHDRKKLFSAIDGGWRQIDSALGVEHSPIEGHFLSDMSQVSQSRVSSFIQEGAELSYVRNEIDFNRGSQLVQKRLSNVAIVLSDPLRLNKIVSLIKREDSSFGTLRDYNWKRSRKMFDLVVARAALAVDNGVIGEDKNLNVERWDKWLAEQEKIQNAIQRSGETSRQETRAISGFISSPKTSLNIFSRILFPVLLVLGQFFSPRAGLGDDKLPEPQIVASMQQDDAKLETLEAYPPLTQLRVLRNLSREQVTRHLHNHKDFYNFAKAIESDEETLPLHVNPDKVKLSAETEAAVANLMKVLGLPTDDPESYYPLDFYDKFLRNFRRITPHASDINALAKTITDEVYPIIEGYEKSRKIKATDQLLSSVFRQQYEDFIGNIKERELLENKRKGARGSQLPFHAILALAVEVKSYDAVESRYRELNPHTRYSLTYGVDKFDLFYPPFSFNNMADFYTYRNRYGFDQKSRSIFGNDVSAEYDLVRHFIYPNSSWYPGSTDRLLYYLFMSVPETKLTTSPEYKILNKEVGIRIAELTREIEKIPGMKFPVPSAIETPTEVLERYDQLKIRHADVGTRMYFAREFEEWLAPSEVRAGATSEERIAKRLLHFLTQHPAFWKEPIEGERFVVSNLFPEDIRDLQVASLREFEKNPSNWRLREDDFGRYITRDFREFFRRLIGDVGVDSGAGYHFRGGTGVPLNHADMEKLAGELKSNFDKLPNDYQAILRPLINRYDEAANSQRKIETNVQTLAKDPKALDQFLQAYFKEHKYASRHYDEQVRFIRERQLRSDLNSRDNAARIADREWLAKLTKELPNDKLNSVEDYAGKRLALAEAELYQFAAEMVEAVVVETAMIEMADAFKILLKDSPEWARRPLSKEEQKNVVQLMMAIGEMKIQIRPSVTFALGRKLNIEASEEDAGYLTAKTNEMRRRGLTPKSASVLNAALAVLMHDGREMQVNPKTNQYQKVKNGMVEDEAIRLWKGLTGESIKQINMEDQVQEAVFVSWAKNRKSDADIKRWADVFTSVPVQNIVSNINRIRRAFKMPEVKATNFKEMSSYEQGDVFSMYNDMIELGVEPVNLRTQQLEVLANADPGVIRQLTSLVELEMKVFGEDAEFIMIQSAAKRAELQFRRILNRARDAVVTSGVVDGELNFRQERWDLYTRNQSKIANLMKIPQNEGEVPDKMLETPENVVVPASFLDDLLRRLDRLEKKEQGGTVVEPRSETRVQQTRREFILRTGLIGAAAAVTTAVPDVLVAGERVVPGVPRDLDELMDVLKAMPIADPVYQGGNLDVASSLGIWLRDSAENQNVLRNILAPTAMPKPTAKPQSSEEVYEEFPRPEKPPMVVSKADKRAVLIKEAQKLLDFEYPQNGMRPKPFNITSENLRTDERAKNKVLGWGAFRANFQNDENKAWQQTEGLADEIIETLKAIDGSDQAEKFFGAMAKIYSLNPSPSEREIDFSQLKSLDAFRRHGSAWAYMISYMGWLVIDFRRGFAGVDDTKLSIAEKYTSHIRNVSELVLTNSSDVRAYFDNLGLSSVSLDVQDASLLKRSSAFGRYSSIARSLASALNRLDLSSEDIRETLKGFIDVQSIANEEVQVVINGDSIQESRWRLLNEGDTMYYWGLFNTNKRNKELGSYREIKDPKGNPITLEDFFSLAKYILKTRNLAAVGHKEVLSEQGLITEVEKYIKQGKNPFGMTQADLTGTNNKPGLLDYIRGNSKKGVLGLSELPMDFGEAMQAVTQFLDKLQLHGKPWPGLVEAQKEFLRTERIGMLLQSSYLLYHEGELGDSEKMELADLSSWVTKIEKGKIDRDVAARILRTDGKFIAIEKAIQKKIENNLHPFFEEGLRRQLAPNKTLQDFNSEMGFDVAKVLARAVSERFSIMDDWQRLGLGHRLGFVVRMQQLGDGDVWLAKWFTDVAAIQTASYMFEGSFIDTELISSAVDRVRLGDTPITSPDGRFNLDKMVGMFKKVSHTDNAFRNMGVEGNQTRRALWNSAIINHRVISNQELADLNELWTKLKTVIGASARPNQVSADQGEFNARLRMVDSLFVSAIAHSVYTNQVDANMVDQSLVASLTDARAKMRKLLTEPLPGKSANGPLIDLMLRMHKRSNERNVIRSRKEKETLATKKLVEKAFELHTPGEFRSGENEDNITRMLDERYQAFMDDRTLVLDTDVANTIINMMQVDGLNVDEAFMMEIYLKEKARVAFNRVFGQNLPKGMSRFDVEPFISAEARRIFNDWGLTTVADRAKALKNLGIKINQKTGETPAQAVNRIYLQVVDKEFYRYENVLTMAQVMQGDMRGQEITFDQIYQKANNSLNGAVTLPEIQTWIAVANGIREIVAGIEVGGKPVEQISMDHALYLADSYLKINLATSPLEPVWSQTEIDQMVDREMMRLEKLNDQKTSKYLTALLRNPTNREGLKAKIKALIGENLTDPIQFKMLVDQVIAADKEITEIEKNRNLLTNFSQTATDKNLAARGVHSLSPIDLLVYYDSIADPLRKFGILELLQGKTGPGDLRVQKAELDWAANIEEQINGSRRLEINRILEAKFPIAEKSVGASLTRMGQRMARVDIWGQLLAVLSAFFGAKILYRRGVYVEKTSEAVKNVFSQPQGWVVAGLTVLGAFALPELIILLQVYPSALFIIPAIAAIIHALVNLVYDLFWRTEPYQKKGETVGFKFSLYRIRNALVSGGSLFLTLWYVGVMNPFAMMTVVATIAGLITYDLLKTASGVGVVDFFADIFIGNRTPGYVRKGEDAEAQKVRVMQEMTDSGSMMVEIVPLYVDKGPREKEDAVVRKAFERMADTLDNNNHSNMKGVLLLNTPQVRDANAQDFYRRVRSIGQEVFRSRGLDVNRVTAIVMPPPGSKQLAYQLFLWWGWNGENYINPSTQPAYFKSFANAPGDRFMNGYIDMASDDENILRSLDNDAELPTGHILTKMRQTKNHMISINDSDVDDGKDSVWPAMDVMMHNVPVIDPQTGKITNKAPLFVQPAIDFYNSGESVWALDHVYAGKRLWFTQRAKNLYLYGIRGFGKFLFHYNYVEVMLKPYPNAGYPEGRYAQITKGTRLWTETFKELEEEVAKFGEQIQSGKLSANDFQKSLDLFESVTSDMPRLVKNEKDGTITPYGAEKLKLYRSLIGNDDIFAFEEKLKAGELEADQAHALLDLVGEAAYKDAAKRLMTFLKSEDEVHTNVVNQAGSVVALLDKNPGPKWGVIGPILSVGLPMIAVPILSTFGLLAGLSPLIAASVYAIAVTLFILGWSMLIDSTVHRGSVPKPEVGRALAVGLYAGVVLFIALAFFPGLGLLAKGLIGFALSTAASFIMNVGRPNIPGSIKNESYPADVDEEEKRELKWGGFDITNVWARAQKTVGVDVASRDFNDLVVNLYPEGKWSILLVMGFVSVLVPGIMEVFLPAAAEANFFVVMVMILHLVVTVPFIRYLDESFRSKNYDLLTLAKSAWITFKSFVIELLGQFKEVDDSQIYMEKLITKPELLFKVIYGLRAQLKRETVPWKVMAITFVVRSLEAYSVLSATAFPIGFNLAVIFAASATGIVGTATAYWILPFTIAVGLRHILSIYNEMVEQYREAKHKFEGSMKPLADSKVQLDAADEKFKASSDLKETNPDEYLKIRKAFVAAQKDYKAKLNTLNLNAVGYHQNNLKMLHYTFRFMMAGALAGIVTGLSMFSPLITTISVGLLVLAAVSQIAYQRYYENAYLKPYTGNATVFENLRVDNIVENIRGIIIIAPFFLSFSFLLFAPQIAQYIDWSWALRASTLILAFTTGVYRKYLVSFRFFPDTESGNKWNNFMVRLVNYGSAALNITLAIWISQYPFSENFPMLPIFIFGPAGDGTLGLFAPLFRVYGIFVFLYNYMVAAAVVSLSVTTLLRVWRWVSLLLPKNFPGRLIQPGEELGGEMDQKVRAKAIFDGAIKFILTAIFLGGAGYGISQHDFSRRVRDTSSYSREIDELLNPKEVEDSGLVKRLERQGEEIVSSQGNWQIRAKDFEGHDATEIYKDRSEIAIMFKDVQVASVRANGYVRLIPIGSAFGFGGGYDDRTNTYNHINPLRLVEQQFIDGGINLTFDRLDEQDKGVGKVELDIRMVGDEVVASVRFDYVPSVSMDRPIRFFSNFVTGEDNDVREVVFDGGRQGNVVVDLKDLPEEGLLINEPYQIKSGSGTIQLKTYHGQNPDGTKPTLKAAVFVEDMQGNSANISFNGFKTKLRDRTDDNVEASGVVTEPVRIKLDVKASMPTQPRSETRTAVSAPEVPMTVSELTQDEQRVVEGVAAADAMEFDVMKQRFASAISGLNTAGVDLDGWFAAKDRQAAIFNELRKSGINAPVIDALQVNRGDVAVRFDSEWMTVADMVAIFELATQQGIRVTFFADDPEDISILRAGGLVVRNSSEIASYINARVNSDGYSLEQAFQVTADPQMFNDSDIESARKLMIKAALLSKDTLALIGFRKPVEGIRNMTLVDLVEGIVSAIRAEQRVAQSA